MFAKISTIAALAALANGHVYMANPKPFASQMISNGPLDPSGSNFPCKSTGSSTYSANGVSNTWQLGSQQTLKTEGTAVHGGGSCQLSITYDTAPTKDSTWKVIHSIEGGCPSRDTTGNLVGNSATAVNPDTYDFTVPDNIPAGDVTFAWTWLNRIGNREFYMNCAPVTLTGSGGSQSDYDSLPDMVVLNTNGITDATKEGVDYKYADPGNSVENNLNKWGWGFQVIGSSGSSDGGSGDSSPAPSSQPQPDPTTSAPGGVFITQTPSATPTVPPTEPEPSSSAPPAPTPSSGAPSGGSGSTAAGSACSTEGEWNCIDGASYQQCASGLWSPVMKMAAGTQCKTGSSQMSVTAINKNKRRNNRRVGRANRA